MRKVGLNDIFGAAGAVTGLFSGISASRRQKKLQEFQRQEHEKDRNFQQKMYERSVQVNRENLSDERSYNSPAKVMERLKAAGLNPDMYYSQGTGLVDANVSEGGTMPSSSTPNYMYNPVQPIQSMLQGTQAALYLAQSRKLEVETEKEKGLVDSVDLDNAIKSATAGSTIELQSMNVRLSKSYLDLNEASRDKVVQEINNMRTLNDQMNATIDNIKASTSKMNMETFRAKFDVYMRSKEFDLQVKRLQQDIKESNSRINLNEAQTREVLGLLLARKLNIQSQTTLNASAASVNFVRRSNLLIEGRQLDFNLKFDKDNKQTMTDINNAVSIVNAVNGMVNGFAHLLGAAVPF